MIARTLLLLAAIAASSGAAARSDPARYMEAKLVAETVAPKPGSTVLVGFRFTPKPGWHGYWSNPGDSGIAPTVRWTAPVGVTFGPLLHPAPTLISADGIDSFVHEGPHVLLSRITIGRSVAPGTPIPVKADLSWAACTATQCIPLRATFTLDLVAGNGAEGPDASLLRAAASKLPRQAAGVTFAVEGNRLRLRLPESLHLDAKQARFFPDEGGYFDVGAARPADEDGLVVIDTPVKGEAPASLTGVVSDGRRSYRVKAEAVPASDAAERPDAEQPSVLPAESPSEASKAGTMPKPEADAPSQTQPQPKQLHWLWLLAAAGMVLASGWLWTRKR